MCSCWITLPDPRSDAAPGGHCSTTRRRKKTQRTSNTAAATGPRTRRLSAKCNRSVKSHGNPTTGGSLPQTTEARQGTLTSTKTQLRNNSTGKSPLGLQSSRHLGTTKVCITWRRKLYHNPCYQLRAMQLHNSSGKFHRVRQTIQSLLWTKWHTSWRVSGPYHSQRHYLRCLQL